MLSLHRGHANLCLAPILVHVLLKRGPSSAGLSQVTLGRFLNLALVISETEVKDTNFPGLLGGLYVIMYAKCLRLAKEEIFKVPPTRAPAGPSISLTLLQFNRLPHVYLR